MLRFPRLLVLALVGVAAAAPACTSNSSANKTAKGSGAGGSGASSSSSSGGTSPSDTTPKPYKPYDVNHVLGSGQSLSLGGEGSPPLSTTQPYHNVMFDTGLEPGGSVPSTFVPLIENAVFTEESGSVIPVETMSSSLANLATKIATEKFGQSDHDVLVSLHGVSGASYPMICKGTDAYAKGLAQVRDAKQIADASGKSYVVRAVTVVHGESDGYQNWNVDYGKALLEWQASYEADIKDITGQPEDVPLFESQYSAWTSVESQSTNIIPGLQLWAHENAPGRVVLVGPKYMLPYAEDGLHLTNEGYRWLGEYYAKVYLRHVFDGLPWEPVRPKTITRDGAKLVVQFFVPAPPLVLDTNGVSNPGNYGFEIVDSASTQITNVAVTAPDTVTISLSGSPSGDAHLRYAFTGTPTKPGGPDTGPRGNLRDSDATPSRYNHALYNWGVHFDKEVP